MDSRDQNLKKDAGKSRLDLFPYADVKITPERFAVESTIAALQTWWSIAPRPLRIGIPRCMLDEVGRVLAFGAQKYEPRGWEKGIAFSRLFAAAMRHGNEILRGNLIDPETGLSHEAHLYCNVTFIVALTERHGAKYDDRPAPNAKLLAQYDQAHALLFGEAEKYEASSEGSN